jgi:hypothetical protein
VTPRIALEALRDLHEPYLPVLAGIVDCQGYDCDLMRAPTVDERAAAVELWCDACRLPAARCVQYPLIVDALRGLA